MSWAEKKQCDGTFSWNGKDKYSCVLNTSHTVLGDMPDFLSETCLYYKTCHTILSKTRLEYRTHQLSIDVTMTSFLF